MANLLLLGVPLMNNELIGRKEKVLLIRSAVEQKILIIQIGEIVISAQ